MLGSGQIFGSPQPAKSQNAQITLGHQNKKVNQINNCLQNDNFSSQDKCILIYHQIVEELHQCF